MPKVTEKELGQLEKLKKRQDKQNAYLKDKYDRLNITVDKGYKSIIEAVAKASGVSVNEFCRTAIIRAVNKSAPEQPEEQHAPEQAEEPGGCVVPFM